MLPPAPLAIKNKAAVDLEERRSFFLSAAQAETYLQQEQAGRDLINERLRSHPLFALCLSGGGIRSAAFCLGVIQTFAKARILKEFHYLSTVSGGGYIGSWLTRLIAQRGGKVEEAEAIVSNSNANLAEPEAPELCHLRRYTNYLAPNPGFASADTWAGLVLYIRNTLINWAIFLPLALAAAAVPVFCLNAVGWAVGFSTRRTALWWFEPIFGCLALAALLFAATGTCLSLPSHTRSGTNAEKVGISVGTVDWRIVLVTLVWVFLAPFVAAPVLSPAPLNAVQKVFCPAAPPGTQAGITSAKSLQHIPRASPPTAPPAIVIPPIIARNTPQLGGLLTPPAFLPLLLPLGAFMACISGYLLAAVLVGFRYWWRDEKWWPHVRAFLRNVPAWGFSALISAIMLYIGARLVVRQSVLWIALAGPLWVVTAEILRSTVYVALRSGGLYSDLDREWLARLSGDKLRWVLAISVLGATAVWLPMFICQFKHGLVGAIAAMIGVAAGPTAAWVGKAASGAFRYGESIAGENIKYGNGRKRKIVVLAAAALFGLTVFALAGRAVVALTVVIYPWLIEFLKSTTLGLLGRGQQQDFGAAAVTVFIALLAFVFVAVAVDWGVNLNRFSMHAVYRNRLIRAFLGTARDHGERRPDPYTQFDPNDNIRIPKTWRTRDRKRLFHVINVSLNYTSGADSARAERKAQPFTITPLHCGGPALSMGEGAYVDTECFACGELETGPDDDRGGITLGTAMAISGAAASPNMGYHSSPPAAFLMTLFNVRLGAWLPNPSYKKITAKILSQSGPIFAIPTLRRELAGQSDDRGKYVYLSDGGHFDNLGLYEMLRRRCALIVVIDAGADPDYAFFDLGHTLNMARVDLGVEISFKPKIEAGPDPKRSSCEIAAIRYLDDDTTGRLILLKPCRPDDLPIELAAYAAIKPKFPHESTLDQFFTESDFECYRQLGALIAGNMLDYIKAARRSQNQTDEAAALEVEDLRRYSPLGPK